jgi:hypothetical protein
MIRATNLRRDFPRGSGGRLTAIVAIHGPMMLEMADRVVELRDGTLV